MDQTGDETMAVSIFIFVFNRPDLLDPQIKTLKARIKNNIKIHVVHDCRDRSLCQQFYDVCRKYDAYYYLHLSKPGKSSSIYHANVLNWVYFNIIPALCKNELVFFLDHDMFLLEDFDVQEYLGDYDVAGLEQIREPIKYIWPGIFLFKESSLREVPFNFLPGSVILSDGTYAQVDSGGGTRFIIEDDTIKYKRTNVSYVTEYNGINMQEVSGGYDCELHLDNKFLHYRNASNWHNNYVISDQEKTRALNIILGDYVPD